MADIEVYCDSEEEVFFGPVTEKERKIAENLRRREMLNRGFRSPPSATDSQDGEEGLHTLAMAAQMLSLSSCDNGECQEEATEYQAEKCQQHEFSTVLPPVDTITRGIMMNTNEGSHLELDAVKFLSRHLPEQNQSGFFQDSLEDKGSFHDTCNIPSAGIVSCMDNVDDALNHWSNTSISDQKIFHKCQDEAEKQMTDSISNEAHITNVEVAKEPDNIPDIDYKYGMLDVKVNCMDWEDANEISKGEFGIKLSDNEEEMEKVERNLKVEEIIKFLADEDDKSKVKLLNDADVKPVDDLSNSKKIMFTSCDDNNSYTHGDQLSNGVYQDPLGPNDEYESKVMLNVTNNLLEIPEEAILPEEIKTEREGCKKVHEVIGDKAVVEVMKYEDKEAYQLDSLAHSMENLESLKEEIAKVPTTASNIKKPQMGSALKKPPSNIKRVPKPKVTPGIERQATPRPCCTPNTYTEFGKHKSTPRPLRPLQSPAMGTTSSKSCVRSLLQQAAPQQAKGTTFKTPNAKAKPTVGSKIPQLCSISPSPNRNKKFAGIVSPVSKYIHSKPVVLISNKKPTAGPTTMSLTDVTKDTENKSPETLDSATPKSLPDLVRERGAENVDMTNHSTLPEVSFKSALPVKIVSANQRRFKSALPFSPISSTKTPTSGKTAIVTKHLGHVKISSIEDGKVVPFECKENLMLNGEVSLLLSKEVELHCPALLRN